jgi:hypothetical protein
MTRDEFLRQRAVADYIKTHGVTRCEPAPAAAEHDIPLTVRTRHKRASNRLQRSTLRRTGQQFDGETGEPIPQRSTVLRALTETAGRAQNDERDR